MTLEDFDRSVVSNCQAIQIVSISDGVRAFGIGPPQPDGKAYALQRRVLVERERVNLRTIHIRVRRPHDDATVHNADFGLRSRRGRRCLRRRGGGRRGCGWLGSRLRDRRRRRVRRFRVFVGTDVTVAVLRSIGVRLIVKRAVDRIRGVNCRASPFQRVMWRIADECANHGVAAPGRIAPRRLLAAPALGRQRHRTAPPGYRLAEACMIHLE